MRNPLGLQQRALSLIEQRRHRLVAPDFCARHRRRAPDFTRQCVLPFPVLMLLLRQKSLKSLPAHRQEFLGQLAGGTHAPGWSGGAFTRARAKRRASAFGELNPTVLDTVYGPEHAALMHRWHGQRLRSVDSSLVRLPARAARGEKFGWGPCAHQHGPQSSFQPSCPNVTISGAA